MNDRQTAVFWDLVEVLNATDFLPHVMIVGSWAEYLYPICLGPDYIPNLKTSDVDVYYGNPFLELPGAAGLESAMRAAGFVPYGEGAGRKTFFKDSVEVEFLSSPMGDQAGMIVIPDTAITAETLEDLSVLDPMEVEAEGYSIKVPTPASYVVHKLLINPKRHPENKRLKDIEAVRLLLPAISNNETEQKRLRIKLEKLPAEQLSIVRKIAKEHGLVIPMLDN